MKLNLAETAEVHRWVLAVLGAMVVASANEPPPGTEERARLDGVAAGLTGALDELREFARGIHPAILADGALGPAVKTLARRCPGLPRRASRRPPARAGRGLRLLRHL
jgi:hypothetical protein